MKNEEISEATKRLMASSLKKFMKKKDFDNITVEENIEDCNISQTTFYDHFDDIYQLLE